MVIWQCLYIEVLVILHLRVPIAGGKYIKGEAYYIYEETHEFKLT